MQYSPIAGVELKYCLLIWHSISYDLPVSSWQGCCRMTFSHAGRRCQCAGKGQERPSVYDGGLTAK